MWHSSHSPSTRSLSRFPSSPPPSFTQSPFPPCSLVRGGQTSPHRPRLVASRSTCPPLSPSPHANSFVIGTSVINTHTQPIGLIPFQARGILPGPEGQSRTRGSQNGGVTDQPQYPGLWRSRTPNARSLSRSPSSSPPSFTQSPSPPRSLVRGGQTSPHRCLRSAMLRAKIDLRQP
jgi:hypothetical protein